MNSCLRHRGPDASGAYLNQERTLALGHTRLSIIDLSQNANQPMHSNDSRFIIAFNGEIYNFQQIRKTLESHDSAIHFKTNSDTEVILHAFHTWGTEMVHHLQGMFVIAIYDSVLDKLFLFRDRIGKKPLFYFCNHEYFLFASEIKALLIHPAVAGFKEIDKQAIHEFLHLGYIPEPKTIYRSIRKFPAGSVGEVWKNLSFSIKPYWSAANLIESGRRYNEKEPLQEIFLNKLKKSVEKRLISDVPIGIFLSGGTDSSLITAIASEQTNKSLKTFSIGFKESKFDEHGFARDVAARLKTDHHQYVLSEREAADLLETYLNQLDEPFADTSTIPTMLVSKMARQEVTVALTGDGGDELFLGYGTYTWARRLAMPLFKTLRPFLSSGLEAMEDARYKRIAHMFEKVDEQHLRSHIFSQEQYFFSDMEMTHGLLKDTIDYESFRYIDPSTSSHLKMEERQALFDLNFYLKDDLLVKTDRASMYYGLECRCPLLDQDIIEFALNAPLLIKRKGDVNKWILKEILKTYLPDDLVNRPKWGFSIPLAQWMKNELSYLMDYLSEDQLKKSGIFNIKYVRNLVTRFYYGEEYLYNRLWALIIVQRFLLKHE